MKDRIETQLLHQNLMRVLDKASQCPSGSHTAELTGFFTPSRASTLDQNPEQAN
jgi:hypothetical protein